MPGSSDSAGEAQGGTNDYLVGATGGLAASLMMYIGLRPLASDGLLPPMAFVARIARLDPASASARAGGLALQGVFGIIWGLLMGYWNTLYYPVGFSYVTQGLVWGLAAFVLSLAAFAGLRILGRPFNLRLWSGYFLNHLLFGAALGLAFLVLRGPTA